MATVKIPLQEALARETGKLTILKIASLQARFCGSNNAMSADARAELARLRRLGSDAGFAWLASGQFIYDGWPRDYLAELGASKRDEERMARTLEMTLELYAIHQQSSSVGCAVIKEKDEDDEAFKKRCRRLSFAHGCRLAKPDLAEATTIMRRLQSIERASDASVVMYHLRSLIRLIKSSKDEGVIQIDYRALAHDLYLIQLPGGWKDGVFARWSQDYFVFDSGSDRQIDLAKKGR